MIPAETQPAPSRNSYRITLAFSKYSKKQKSSQMLGDGLYPEVVTVQSLHPSEKCLLIWCIQGEVLILAFFKIVHGSGWSRQKVKRRIKENYYLL